MARKMNILFIMTDQLRWDALGCTGGWVRTPTIDRLAEEGVRFTKCVTGSPVCVSARVNLATGLYCHNTGVWNNGNYALPADSTTWMQAIRQAGYRTSLFGKAHLYPHGRDLRDKTHLLHAYGLDDVDEIAGPRASATVYSNMTARWEALGLWDGYRKDFADRFSQNPYIARPSPLPLEEYADVYVGRQAAEYLKTYSRSEPWFCWVSFGGPHEPWDAPEPYASQYAPESMPTPIPIPEWRGERPSGGLDWRYEHLPALSPDAVAARGELDYTIIAFTSDHGELNGDHGLIYKSTFLDGAVRVPLLVRTPCTKGDPVAGRCCDAPVELADLGPTLAELAGAELE
jgi:choline-sulfatase